MKGARSRVSSNVTGLESLPKWPPQNRLIASARTRGASASASRMQMRLPPMSAAFRWHRSHL
eukprot:scaffold181256_cov38-Tisochrysis_lutea.AAC.2